MANPTWFNAKEYLANKLAQLKATDADGGWTTESLTKAMEKDGYTGDEGAYKHFNDFGMNENISPSAAFNVSEYLAAKVAQLNDIKFEGKVWSEATLMKAITDAGMKSAWEHFDKYGSQEGINPSNSFDTSTYFLQKTILMNETKEGGRADWTVDQVKAAFDAAGLNVVEHYALFGEAEFKAANKDTTTLFAPKTQVETDTNYDPYTGVNTYATLKDALAAQKDGTLAVKYSIADAAAAGEVTVAQQAGLKDFLAKADPAISTTPTYTLEDTVANIGAVSGIVRTGSTVNGIQGHNILDSLVNVVAGNDGVVNEAANAYGTVEVGATINTTIKTTVTYDDLKDKVVATGNTGITLKVADATTAKGEAVVIVDAHAEKAAVGTSAAVVEMSKFFNNGDEIDNITLKYVASDKGDSIQGTLDSDIIVGGKGSDLLYGSATNARNTAATDASAGDIISGGAGADRMYGSTGNDTIYGNAKGADADLAGTTNINAGRYAGGAMVSTGNVAFLGAVDKVTGSDHTSKIGLTNVFNGWLGDDTMYATSATDSFEYHTGLDSETYATSKFSSLGTDTIHGFELGKDMLLINMIEAPVASKGHGITLVENDQTTQTTADILIKANVATTDVATAAAGKVSWTLTALTDKALGADGVNDWAVHFVFGDNTDTLDINFVDVVGTPTTAADFLIV